MKPFAIFLILATFAFASNGMSLQQPLKNTISVLKADQLKDVELSGVFYNDCCEELVSIAGTGHLVLRNGNFNTSHIDIKGATGVGENGRVYTQKGSLTQNINLDEDFTEGTFNISMKMVSDDGCSFTIHEVYHLQMNANGDVTVERDKYTITCEK